MSNNITLAVALVPGSERVSSEEEIIRNGIIFYSFYADTDCSLACPPHVLCIEKNPNQKAPPPPVIPRWFTVYMSGEEIRENYPQGLMNRITHRLKGFCPQTPYLDPGYIINRIPDGINCVSPTGDILYANESISRILGIPREKFMDMNIRDYISPEYISKSLLFLEELEKQGRVNGFETVYLASSGERIPVVINSQAIRDEEGKFISSCSSVRVWDPCISREQMEKQHQQWEKEIEHLVFIISHELKSPITAILGYLSLIKKEDKLLSPEQKHFIERSYFNCMFLKRALESLLEYSRIGRSIGDYREINLGEKIDMIFRVVKEKYRNHVEAVLYRESLPSFYGDAALINRLLEAILDNCFKFRSPDHPLEIKVTSSLKDRFMEISVTDNGTGILARDREQVFKMFKKARGNKDPQSLGMGLAFVEKIVHTHGGQVFIDSPPNETTPGQTRGTTLRFTLPLSQREIWKKIL